CCHRCLNRSRSNYWCCTLSLDRARNRTICAAFTDIDQTTRLVNDFSKLLESVDLFANSLAHCARRFLGFSWHIKNAALEFATCGVELATDFRCSATNVVGCSREPLRCLFNDLGNALTHLLCRRTCLAFSA